MTVLAIETATANRAHTASIALLHQGVRQQIMLPEPNSQAAKLVVTIESLLKAHALWYDQLSTLAITIGPGSFTGIRIGLAVARSIAFACPALKLVPMTTLDALAAHYDGPAQQIRCVIKAGKGEVYSQAFALLNQQWHPQDAIGLYKPDDLPTDLPLYGNGLPDLAQESDAGMILDALEKTAITPREAAPLYIRAPDAKLPSKPVL